jgi:hypothetical protein
MLRCGANTTLLVVQALDMVGVDMDIDSYRW